MWNDSKIGTLALYKKTHLIATADLSLQDNVKYASTQVFTQGSTNGPM